MYCAQDCVCSICRELRGFKPKQKFFNKSSRHDRINNNNNNNNKNQNNKKNANDSPSVNSKSNRSSNSNTNDIGGCGGRIPATKTSTTITCNDNFILRRRLSDFGEHHQINYHNNSGGSNSNSSGGCGGSGGSGAIEGPSTKSRLSLLDISSTTTTNSSANQCKSNKIKIKNNSNDDNGIIIKTERFSPKLLTKSKSYTDLWKRFDPRNVPAKKHDGNGENIIKKVDQHKVIIYFGDSVSDKKHSQPKLSLLPNDNNVGSGATTAAVEPDSRSDLSNKDKKRSPPMFSIENKKNPPPKPPNHNEQKSPKLHEQSNFLKKPPQINNAPPKPERPTRSTDKHMELLLNANNDKKSLPSFIQNVVNGVINIKIENSFNHAMNLVQAVHSIDKTDDENNLKNNDDDFDWSFVQNWRTRPSAHSRNDFIQEYNSPTNVQSSSIITLHNSMSPSSTPIHSLSSPPTSLPPPSTLLATTSTVTTPSTTSVRISTTQYNGNTFSTQITPGMQYFTTSSPLNLSLSSSISSGRIQNPAIATPAPRISKEVAYRPSDDNNNNNRRSSMLSPSSVMSSCTTNPTTRKYSNPYKFHEDLTNEMTDSGQNSSHHHTPKQQQHHHQQQLQQQQPFSQMHNQSVISNGITSTIAISNITTTTTTTTPTMIPERDTEPSSKTASKMLPPIVKSIPHRPISGPAKLTIQSIPVKSQPPMISSGLSNQHKTAAAAHAIAAAAAAVVTSSSAQKQLKNASSQATPSQQSIGNNEQHLLRHQPPLPPTTSLSSSSSSASASAMDSQNYQHKTTIASTMNMVRTHHHGGTHEFRTLHRVSECHSSSDENRSSGHASMSDTGHGSSSPSGLNHHSNSNDHLLGQLPEERLAAGVTSNRSARSRASTGHSRSRQRGAPTKVPWSGGGLEDIKLAIQQLTMRSQTSTSTYSSLSAGSESSEPARRLARYSSLETVNTNVTTADEFVWVDSHNRLVELQHPPWSQHCVLRVIRSGRCREHADRVSVDTIPRLGYLLQRALVRISREVQRLSSGLGICSKHELSGAFKIVLCRALADSCIKACLRAAAMFAVPGDSALKQSKSSRAGVQLPVGRFHRWMADARLGKFVHEYAAVYLCAGLENLLEEIVLQCLPVDSSLPLTATGLEHAIACSGDLWGLLQPFAHLNAGRVASGALTMPRWTSQSSLGSSATVAGAAASTASGGGGVGYNSSQQQNSNFIAIEPCLLTTCVGSIDELKDLVLKSQNKFHHIVLSHAALIALFYFMRCSQLEHSDVVSTNGKGPGSNSGPGSVGGGAAGVGGDGSGVGSGVTGGGTSGGTTNIQELCYERAYVVLPPLIEWLRVCTAHSEYRHSILIDKDDIMQAARLLLPGVDTPPRTIASEDELPSQKGIMPPSLSPQPQHQQQQQQQQQQMSATSGSVNVTNGSASEDISEYGRRATLALAFRLMMSGRPELLIQANSLLPVSTKYDTLNQHGMTALMIAVIRNDEQAMQMLLDAGADPNIEIPKIGTQQGCPSIHPEIQKWTAVTFAACRGNYNAARLLLERGGHVEGGARLGEDNGTLTPLQVSSGSGYVDVVSLLLSHGANAFLSTQQKDSLCFSGTAQRGCFSAISVAAAHGQRATLRKLLSHPLAPGSREVLSLEEMLAEGDSTSSRGNGAAMDRNNGNIGGSGTDSQPALSKTQIKCLQEAMYHSAENNHLDITMELRALGVPWTLHCWMHALAAAHELRLDAVIDQLLQDFLQVCPDDYSSQFVSECLPLLFNIFRYSKKEGTTLLLADIFATCFGWEPIKHIKEPVLQPVNGSRIDPKFVNNPELSDVMFRVEGKIFYGHKIVLVTASPRFQSMLSSKLSECSTPTVQINDIRYHIFQLVMQFLYNGGCNTLDVVSTDVLELMAAASFFQLDGLLRYTESQCSNMIDIDNVVAMYIHAKVYSAPKLMEYCQGFLLQNMVALLTYDDSVKRLLFAKKIPNHDVLSGLLITLQERIKERRNGKCSLGNQMNASGGSSNGGIGANGFLAVTNRITHHSGSGGG